MTKQYDTVCPQPSTLCIRRLQTDFIRTILTEIYHMHLYLSTNELVIANIYIILLGFYAFQIFLLHLLLLCNMYSTYFIWFWGWRHICPHIYVHIMKMFLNFILIIMMHISNSMCLF